MMETIDPELEGHTKREEWRLRSLLRLFPAFAFDGHRLNNLDARSCDVKKGLSVYLPNDKMYV